MIRSQLFLEKPSSKLMIRTNKNLRSYQKWPMDFHYTVFWIFWKWENKKAARIMIGAGRSTGWGKGK